MIEQEDLENFIQDTGEALEELDTALFELNQRSAQDTCVEDNAGLLEQIFRILHTIKGVSGFFSFNKIEKIAHVTENLLSAIMAKELPLCQTAVEDLIDAVGVITDFVKVIEENGQEPDRDITEVVSKITGQHGAQKKETCPSQETPNAPKTEPFPACSMDEVDLDDPEALEALFDQIVDQKLKEENPTTSPSPSNQEKEGSQNNQEKETNSSVKSTQKATKGAKERTIRVNTELLDGLLNNIGELVLTRNQVIQYAEKTNDAYFMSASQTLSRITSEIQEGIMLTRMQPVGTIWKKIPRVAYDLAKELGKDIKIEMEGESTELDRALLEALTDPITHIIRNAVDHGIEMPQDRENAKKNKQGTVKIKAYHENGQIIIEFCDDGKGVCCETLKKKAITQNAITPEEARLLTDEEAVNLVFLPSLSTKENVTNISGRGVGMDVVKSNIEKIGGQVEFSSQQYKGSKLKIKLPLTLAIIQSLGIICQDTHFSVPQSNVIELIHITPEKKQHKIECIKDTLMLDMRGTLLPLIDLNKILFQQPYDIDELLSKKETSVVILHANGKSFGVIIDKVADYQEIVVKPLTLVLNKLNLFAGASILGDGNISIILDVNGLADHCKLTNIGKSNENKNMRINIKNQYDPNNQQKYLLVESPEKKQFALPLDAIERFANFNSKNIENHGMNWMIKYRNEILPLIFFDDSYIHHYQNEENNNGFDVVILREGDQLIGFVVGTLVDIIESEICEKATSTRTGVAFNGLINGKISEIVDVDYFVKQVQPYTSQGSVSL